MRISDWSSDVCSSDLAQTSPATFYVYFKGVPEVVLAALEGASQTSPELEAIIARDWLVPGADEAAAALVQCYTDLWNRHRTIFVLRNLAAVKGDVRLYEARMKTARTLMDASRQQVERVNAPGRPTTTESSQARVDPVQS